MAISIGETLPEATLVHMGKDGPEGVALSEKLKGRKVVIFALPGAFTGVCTTAHVPSFIRTKDAFAEKGVDEIICISVNDPFVMAAWGESTGATEAGLIDRSKRYAMLVDDGVVKLLQAEESPGTCDISGGEALLSSM